MKIRLFPFAAVAVVMASCSNEDVMELNPDPAGDALSFSIAVSHSRATETKIDNLGNFCVVAKGIHPHGGVYDNYLIGGKDGGLLARKQSAVDGKHIWALDQNIYWPTSTPSAVFWAYNCTQDATATEVLPSGAKFKFDENDKNTAKITGFTPARADLTKASDDGYWNDGAVQTDLLVAFAHQERSVSSTNVALTFNHALTQIDIKAQSKGKSGNDHRIVRIKGAWFVRTNDKADLSAGFTFTPANDDTSTPAKAEVATKWENHGFINAESFSAYGSFYNEPLVLSKAGDEQKLLGANGSLMLLPQNLVAWNRSQENDIATDDNNGAYILLLCRVELEHPGASHSSKPEGETDDVYVVGTGETAKHYHQQFPVNANNKFEPAEYGFVCVPVGKIPGADKDYSLDMGKKYQFTLDICGATTGAGYYPPLLDETILKKLIPTENKFVPFGGDGTLVEVKTVTDRPAGKKIGDEVLDGPIQFEVKVSGWAEDDEWTNGQLPL